MDPLAPFRVGTKVPKVFSACFENQQPVDIGAQMEKAARLIELLVADGILNKSNPRRLLILGGGVAGVTAAVTASRREIPVTLVDKKRVLISRQANCDKYLYPYLYRWPDESWKQSSYVPTSPNFTAWKDAPSNAVAVKWQRSFSNHAKSVKRRLKCQLGCNDFATKAKNWDGVLSPLEKDKLYLGYQAIILALGYYEERCTIPGDAESDPPKHKSESYWSMDGFHNDRPKNWIISGGGDGGLQDFIRIATRKEIHILANDLFDGNEAVIKKPLDDLREKLGKLDNPRKCDEAIDEFIDNLPVDYRNNALDYFKKASNNVPYLLVNDSQLPACYPLNALMAKLINKANNSDHILAKADLQTDKLGSRQKDGTRDVVWTGKGASRSPMRAKLIIRHGQELFTRK